MFLTFIFSAEKFSKSPPLFFLHDPVAKICRVAVALVPVLMRLRERRIRSSELARRRLSVALRRTPDPDGPVVGRRNEDPRVDGVPRDAVDRPAVAGQDGDRRLLLDVVDVHLVVLGPRRYEVLLGTAETAENSDVINGLLNLSPANASEHLPLQSLNLSDTLIIDISKT